MSDARSPTLPSEAAPPSGEGAVPPVPDTSGPARCKNCNTPLTGAYCTVCDQRAGRRVVPLWQVTNEFLEDLVDLDLRILRTLPTFFFRPGRLTAEYMEGRRRRYIRPLRLYLSSSFLLFTILALTNLNSLAPPFTASAAHQELQDARAEVRAVRAELEALQAGPNPLLKAEGQAPGSAEAHSTPPDPIAALQRRPLEATPQNLRRAGQTVKATGPAVAADLDLGPALEASVAKDVAAGMADAQASLSAQGRVARVVRDPMALIQSVLDRAPYLLFLLVPTFALLLKVLYLPRRRLYLEHLIFALHVHAFTFIILAARIGLGWAGIGTALRVDAWLAATPVGYLLLALRHVYGQSWLATGAKTLVLLAAYGLLIVAAVVALVLLTVTYL